MKKYMFVSIKHLYAHVKYFVFPFFFKKIKYF